jgi:hypothetical protein
MFSTQQFPAVYAPFSSDPMRRSNIYQAPMVLQSRGTNPDMYSLTSAYPMAQIKQRFGMPVGHYNLLGHPFQPQPQIPLTCPIQNKTELAYPAVQSEDLVKFLVDDRRRDLNYDNAIYRLFNSIKQNRHSDKVLAALYTGQPIQPEFLLHCILSDRMKVLKVSEIIEKILYDRLNNRKTDAGI